MTRRAASSAVPPRRASPRGPASVVLRAAGAAARQAGDPASRGARRCATAIAAAIGRPRRG